MTIERNTGPHTLTKPLMQRWCAPLALALAIGVAPIQVLADAGGYDSDDELAHPGFWKSLRCLEFSELRMTLEQNATDGDTEVVLFAKGQDDGLKRFIVIAPDGRRVANLKGDASGIGIREFSLESAEPPQLELVLNSFPQGDYHFFGRTVTGKCIVGTAPLSHDIAPATALLNPVRDQVVPVKDVVLRWAAVGGAERYMVELNNENTGATMTFDVFPPTTRLRVPSQFLVPGSTYQFVVGVRTASGNATFVELTFFTAL